MVGYTVKRRPARHPKTPPAKPAAECVIHDYRWSRIRNALVCTVCNEER